LLESTDGLKNALKASILSTSFADIAGGTADTSAKENL
jgi:hypothetical protein